MGEPLILQLEAALIHRLAPSLALPVAAFPPDPGQWRMTHPQGQVLVLYQGARWTDSGSYVERVLTWTVVAIVRNMRTHEPAYALLETIEGLLDGWTPLADDPVLYIEPFYVRADRFTTQEEGLWYWEVELTLTVQSPSGQGVITSTLDDFLRWRDKFDLAPLNDESTSPVVDYPYFDVEDYVDLPGPD